MRVDKATTESLVAAARAVRDRAYAPASKFRVGAAVLTASGKVFVGCNVENASYGLTICAERAAVFAMVAAGERSIAAVAVATGTARPSSPCGACRQVLAEFRPKRGDVRVLLAGKGKALRACMLGELLPRAFTLRDVARGS
jgi:cytidine deaminase